MVDDAENLNRFVADAAKKRVNAIANVRQLPQQSVVNVGGVPPTTIIPSSGNVIPAGPAIPTVNPVVQAGKAQLSITPEMEKLVSQYDMFLGKSIKDMTAKEIVDSYNYLRQFLGQ